MGDFSRRDRGSRDDSRDTGRDRGGRDEGRGRDRDPAPERLPARDRGGRERESSRGSSGSGRGFTYQSRSREAVEKRANMGANDFDKILKPHIKMWSPKDKDNRIRILPPTWPKPEHFGYDIHVHYGVGPDRASYLDLFKMLGEADPITEEMVELRRTGDASDDEIKAMDSKRRVLVYLVDRDDEAEGVQAWAMPWTVDRDISNVSIDKGAGEVLNIDDPEEGYDVEFRKDGKGISTKYNSVAIARRSSRLGKQDWLDFAIDNPLPDQLAYFTYDEIAKVFGGGGGEHRERDRGNDREPSRQERDERPSSRDEGRDRDRGSERGRSEDAPRDRAPERGGDRGRSREPELTWETIHDMTGDELDALIANDDRLDKIDPNAAETDEQLADWICEDLNIQKAATRTRTRVAAEPDAGATDKLAEMRARRGR